MTETSDDVEKNLPDIPLPECKALLEFLRISSRPKTSARATERYLMSSLAMALRSRHVQS